MQKNTAKLKIFTGFVAILLVLVLLVFFSGCTNNDNDPPIKVTINSAYKTTEIRGVPSKPGTFFVVVNMTIENRGDKDYTFNDKTVNITNGKPIEELLYTRLTDRGYWGKIPPNEKRTGVVIFGVKDSAQDFTLKFIYNNGQESVTQNLGNVPVGADSPSPRITTSTVSGSQGSDNAKLLNVTIHSAFKTLDIRGSTSNIENIFVVVNMTIENLGNTDYQFNENTIGITDGAPMTHKLYTHLRNPIHWGSIPPHEKRTGEVVFGVIASTQQFTVTFLNNNNKVILTHEISNIPVVKDYSTSILPAGLLESKNFTYVVKNLDTAEKAAQYAEEKFTFLDRRTCVGQTAYEFFTVPEGDCLSYANFFSYVLAQHGYDVKKVSFKYTDRRVRLGHVVTLFTDSDGQLKYATTPDLRVFRNVNSVEDLIAQEKKRLGIIELDIKNGTPNFVTIPVEDTSSCH